MTLAALKRGDKVIATTRRQSFEEIQDLKTFGADILQLDVTAHIDELRQIADEAVKLYGHVDVVMNNAGKLSDHKGAVRCLPRLKGFLQSGCLEEITNEDMVTQFKYVSKSHGQCTIGTHRILGA